jgi:hypothetical protein
MSTYYDPKANPDTDETGGKKGKTKKSRLNWKAILAVAAALVILWQVYHALANHTNSTSSPRSHGNAQSASPLPTSTPAPTVTLGHHRVSAGGGPMIVLNPGQVTPGGYVAVDGDGFRPRSPVTVLIRAGRHGSQTVVAHGMTTRDGLLTTSFRMPASVTGGSKAAVVAEQGGTAVATAPLTTPGGVGTVAIVGKAAGKPGDMITFSARGFGPGETVNVYWGRTAGTPAATLTADASGSVGRASIRVGVAPVGNTTLVLVGTRTHTTATAPYLMLGLYPSTVAHPYAARPGKPITFRGSGFAPGEQVLIYLNAARGVPALTATADSGGSFSTGFVVPFGLKGGNRLTAIGSQSRASVTSGFTVLPFSPSAQPSTYSALPGTSVSFYATGFAPNEVVLVYVNGGQGKTGQLVSAFRVNAQGKASAVGHYVVTSGEGPALHFSLVGKHSGSTAGVKLSVAAPAQPVTVPSQPPYVLPPSLGGKPTAKPTPKPSGSKSGQG